MIGQNSKALYELTLPLRWVTGSKERQGRIKVILFCLISIVTCNGFAQNLFFSHAESGKNFYNPAYCNYNSLSFTILHRNTFITNDISQSNMSTGIDIPIQYSFKRLNNAYISFFLFDERMSTGGYIRQTGGLLAVNQNIRISEHSLLGLGLQYSYYVKSFSSQLFYTGSQWDPYLGFNPALPNGEQLIHQHSNISSLTAGLFWQKFNPENIAIAYAGIAAFSLNKPFENFTGNITRTLPRYSIIAGYRVFDNRKFFIIPELTMYSFANQSYLSVGMKTGIYTFANNPFLPFHAGNIVLETRYINRNALFGLALDQPHYNVGFSYDFPFAGGDFKNTSAFELHLTVKLWRKKVQKPVVASQDYTIGQARKFFEDQKSTSATKEDLKTENKSPKPAPTNKPIALALKKDFKFGFNDATLNDEALQYLDELVELLKSNERMYIEIIGHTDDVGTQEANRIISYRRAQVVADYLISKGIPAERINVVGKLDTEPLLPNTSPENRAKNRRVEFILYQY